MEKAGWIVEAIEYIDVNWQTYQSLHASKEQQLYKKSLADTLCFLKKVNINKDIDVALSVEELMLRQERALFANSPEEANSIAAALEQLKEAKKSLVIVGNSESYQLVAETYPPKRKEAGLPIDSFREFLKSHSTRLANRLASPLSVPEKNLLRQRKENLSMVKDVYIGMQREALGLKSPEKSKGLALEI